MVAPGFLKDGRNALHAARLAGLCYLVGAAVVFWFDYFHHDLRAHAWVPRAAYTAGWWIAFCDKPPAHSITELLKGRRHAIGLALVVVGLVMSFCWRLR
jgi:hypothetical protein